MKSNHDQSGSASDAKAPDPAATEMHKAVGLWDRITEHKILQWGLGYLGAALALAHGQELLAETYEWPHVIGQVVMGVLIIGLPIVLTLAWYHGHKGLKRISTAEAAIIALLLVVGGGGFFIFVHPYESHGGLERPATATTPAIQSPTAAAMDQERVLGHLSRP